MAPKRVNSPSQSDKETARDVYEEFCTWDKQYSMEALSGLQRPTNLASELPHVPTRPKRSNNKSNRTGDGFRVEDFPSGEKSWVATKKVEVDRVFSPSAKYEVCTPISRSILIGDDPEDMEFPPYPDDPDFSFERYDEEYKYYEWQRFHLDPDLEFLATELLKRLQISPDDVAISGSRPFPGITAVSQRRDYPKMPQGWSGPLPYNPNHAHAGPREMLYNLARYFCNNPNCVVSYCDVHHEVPIPEAVVPTASNDALASSVTMPCDNNCFTLGLSTRPVDDIWTDSDFELVELLFKYSPDAMPCDLATISRKPCYQIFQHRQKYLSILPKPKRPNKRPNPPHFDDRNFAQYTPNLPCGHPGPCDSTSNCICWQNNAHCTLSCRCDKKCIRQRKGCGCSAKNGKVACNSRICSCIKDHLECDPRICLCSCRKDASDGQGCQNVGIQHGWTKEIEVRQTRWGLGLFLLEDAKPDDLIIEYTGELIFEPTTRSRDYLVSHRGRGYLFQLNSTLSIDSAFLGNPSRYINHDVAGANCKAQIRLVNGEHRIGVFATRRLKKGDEIFFNYGPSFFESSQSKPVASQTSELTAEAVTSDEPPPQIPDNTVDDPTYEPDSK